MRLTRLVRSDIRFGHIWTLTKLSEWQNSLALTPSTLAMAFFLKIRNLPGLLPQTGLPLLDPPRMCLKWLETRSLQKSMPFRQAFRYLHQQLPPTTLKNCWPRPTALASHYLLRPLPVVVAAVCDGLIALISCVRH